MPVKILKKTNGIPDIIENDNDEIKEYSEKTKKQLINEIIFLKEKIKCFEEIHNKKEIRQQKCISELKGLLNNK